VGGAGRSRASKSCMTGPPGVLAVGPGALLEGDLLSGLGKLHLGERRLQFVGPFEKRRVYGL
jgi:hypothetical protein